MTQYFYNKDIADSLWLPKLNQYKETNFDDFKCENIYISHTIIKDPTVNISKFDFIKYAIKDTTIDCKKLYDKTHKEELKLHNRYEDKINKIQHDMMINKTDRIDEMKKIINKYYKDRAKRRDKYNYKLYNIRLMKVMVTRKFKLNVTQEQKELILYWMDKSIDVYNYLIKFSQDKHNDIDWNFITFRNKIMGTMPKNIYGNTPIRIVADTIHEFINNRNTNCKNVMNKKITHFDLKMKNKYKLKHFTITIQNQRMTQTGLYPSLNNLSNKNTHINFNNIKHDCKLTYDKVKKSFYLYVPQYNEYKYTPYKNNVISLDPGEKTFMTGYGLNHVIKIGNDIRFKILKIEKIIEKMKREIKKYDGANKKDRRRRNHFRRVINKNYIKMRNFTDELHWKTANYLCRNYENIIIPNTSIQSIVKNNKIKIKNDQPIDQIKNQLKQWTRTNKLNKRVKFVLLNLRHYLFRQRLLAKGKEHGCRIIEVDESYTSMTCGFCGVQKKQSGRIHKCPECKMEIDRDANGARNILMKNIKMVINIKDVSPV
ncbi:MAG: transposase [Faunusvirus sp.]|jgi:transposase|uniref:Transposase n=1 Tax=Faunusvirus sp. TaxID=2487766 RepID=A0A3G4ZX90_9VIRU|nr:MAG: transposase [Faunusvirus sp.]